MALAESTESAGGVLVHPTWMGGVQRPPRPQTK